MNLKALLLVVIISVIIGAGIFFGNRLIMKPGAQEITKNLTTKTPVQITPSASPLPTDPPITENSNLNDEIVKLTPRDFSEDYADLSKELLLPNSP